MPSAARRAGDRPRSVMVGARIPMISVRRALPAAVAVHPPGKCWNAQQMAGAAWPSPLVGCDHGWATPSLRPTRHPAPPNQRNPAEHHLSAAGNCSDNRSRRSGSVCGRLSARRAAARAELARIRGQLGNRRQNRISLPQGSAVAASARRCLGCSDLQRRRSRLAAPSLYGGRFAFPGG